MCDDGKPCASSLVKSHTHDPQRVSAEHCHEALSIAWYANPYDTSRCYLASSRYCSLGYSAAYAQLNRPVEAQGTPVCECHAGGFIDEDEFFFLLQFLGIEVSEQRQEQLFKQYDADGSGTIDYDEFKQIWVRLANVRKVSE